VRSVDRLADALDQVTSVQPRVSDLAFERQRRAALLRRFPGFCYTLDKDLRFTSSEGPGLAFLNLQDNELVGRRVTELWGTERPDYEPHACHLRALAGGVAHYRDVCFGRSLEYELQPLRDEFGYIVGVLGVGTDVTEREAARREEAQRVAQRSHAQRIESLGLLAGGVAHDFNNLLTCIVGNLALIERFGQGNQHLEHHLAEANEAVDRATRLTRQLLEFGRKRAVTPKAINLSRLVGRTEEMLAHLIGENIQLKTVLPDELWSVRADAGQLEQALVNLVVNARDAIQGTGTITISTQNVACTESLSSDIDTLSSGAYVELSVTDSGRGMSESVRARLFEPFFTTKEAGQGTGLGLPTVYSAARQNGGTVFVTSRLGAGSTFRILIPALLDGAAEVVEVANPPVDADYQTGTETVLIVEDEPLLLELSSCTLEQLGYRVLSCQNADAALRALEAENGAIDLLFTDVVLPDMSGKDLASRIRSRRPEVRVVYTSGYSRGTIEAQGLEDSYYLEKPYRPTQLAKAIRVALDNPVLSTRTGAAFGAS
jgi:two-component system, cell cycle sensor histidine kinase and response regulator CckA